MDLSDQVVLVTGGTGTLGDAVVPRLLDEGAQVITTYLDDEEWQALKDSAASDRLKGFKTDVTAADQVRQVVKRVIEEYGRIDVLLHLVGAWKGGDDLHEVDEEVWDTMMNVNLKSAFLVTRAVLPVMEENGFGRIICIGSQTGHNLPAKGGPYAVAKQGLEAVTTIVAKEHENTNITMNCLLPSIIDTPRARERFAPDNTEDWATPATITDLIIDTITSNRNGEAIPVGGA